MTPPWADSSTAEHGDYDGLSFSLNPPTRSKQYPVAVTTIEAVNAAGILTTDQKGNHVSIKPVNGTVNDWITQGIVPTNRTVAEWMAQGMNSHWSSILSSIVIEIGE